MNFRQQLKQGIAALCITALPFIAVAESFPTKAVTLIVPQAPGAGTDLIARMIASKLVEKWGQPIVVENRPGANGIIGSRQLVGSDPDGYTLLFQGATHVTNPFAQKDLPYDTIKDFTALGLTATTPYVLAAEPETDANNLQQVLETIRDNPDGVSVGAGDNSTRLIGGVIGSRADINFQTVPYKGGAQMLTDLMGGHIQFGISSVSSTYTGHQNGNIKILAVLNEERSQALPTIPTSIEQGLSGQFPTYWYGLFGPAGMDQDLAAKISQDFADVLMSTEINERLIGMGIDPVGGTPDQFQERIESDLKLWGDLITQTGIRLDQ